jgi:hypothetical protein
MTSGPSWPSFSQRSGNQEPGTDLTLLSNNRRSVPASPAQCHDEQYEHQQDRKTSYRNPYWVRIPSPAAGRTIHIDVDIEVLPAGWLDDVDPSAVRSPGDPYFKRGLDAYPRPRTRICGRRTDGYGRRTKSYGCRTRLGTGQCSCGENEREQQCCNGSTHQLSPSAPSRCVQESASRIPPAMTSDQLLW